jgi:hypothetical protein
VAAPLFDRGKSRAYLESDLPCFIRRATRPPRASAPRASASAIRWSAVFSLVDGLVRRWPRGARGPDGSPWRLLRVPPANLRAWRLGEPCLWACHLGGAAVLPPARRLPAGLRQGVPPGLVRGLVWGLRCAARPSAGAAPRPTGPSRKFIFSWKAVGPGRADGSQRGFAEWRWPRPPTSAAGKDAAKSSRTHLRIAAMTAR